MERWKILQNWRFQLLHTCSAKLPLLGYTISFQKLWITWGHHDISLWKLKEWIMIINSGNITLSEHYHCHQTTQHAKKRTQILSISWKFHKHIATDLHVVLPLTLEILYACVKESTTGTRHISVQSGISMHVYRAGPRHMDAPKQINNLAVPEVGK